MALLVALYQFVGGLGVDRTAAHQLHGEALFVQHAEHVLSLGVHARFIEIDRRDLRSGSARGDGRTPRPPRVAFLLVAFAALAAVACSNSTSSGPHDLCANSGAAVTVTITDYAFTPADITLIAGQSVCWQNTGHMTHTVTDNVAGRFLMPRCRAAKRLSTPSAFRKGMPITVRFIRP